LTGLWHDKLYAIVFVLIWEYLNCWNPEGAYIALETLTGQAPVIRRERAISLTQCPGGNGQNTHMVDVAETMTCAHCGISICQQHTWVHGGQRYCWDCHPGRRSV
jgi:hypothetical protein